MYVWVYVYKYTHICIYVVYTYMCIYKYACVFHICVYRHDIYVCVCKYTNFIYMYKTLYLSIYIGRERERETVRERRGREGKTVEGGRLDLYISDIFTQHGTEPIMIFN